MIETVFEKINFSFQEKSGCLFCNPFPEMLVRQTKNFNLLADSFPVTVMHLMISSKDHYGCAGEIPSEMQAELIALKNHIATLYRQKYGQVIFYEHGRAGGCLANNPNESQCEHFHLHVLPVNIDITNELDKSFSKVNMSSYEEIFEHYYAYGNYLFFENNSGELFFYLSGNTGIRSHLLRTLVCKELDIVDRADWRKYKEKDIWLESVCEIKKLLV